MKMVREVTTIKGWEELNNSKLSQPAWSMSVTEFLVWEFKRFKFYYHMVIMAIRLHRLLVIYG